MCCRANGSRERGVRLTAVVQHAVHPCQGYTGSLGHEDVDAQSFVEWGFDFVKHDTCGVRLPFCATPLPPHTPTQRSRTPLGHAAAVAGPCSVWRGTLPPPLTPLALPPPTGTAGGAGGTSRSGRWPLARHRCACRDTLARAPEARPAQRRQSGAGANPDSLGVCSRGSHGGWVLQGYNGEPGDECGVGNDASGANCIKVRPLPCTCACERWTTNLLHGRSLGQHGKALRLGEHGVHVWWWRLSGREGERGRRARARV